MLVIFVHCLWRLSLCILLFLQSQQWFRLDFLLTEGLDLILSNWLIFWSCCVHLGGGGSKHRYSWTWTKKSANLGRPHAPSQVEGRACKLFVLSQAFKCISFLPVHTFSLSPASLILSLVTAARRNSLYLYPDFGHPDRRSFSLPSHWDVTLWATLRKNMTLLVVMLHSNCFCGDFSAVS